MVGASVVFTLITPPPFYYILVCYSDSFCFFVCVCVFLLFSFRVRRKKREQQDTFPPPLPQLPPFSFLSIRPSVRPSMFFHLSHFARGRAFSFSLAFPELSNQETAPTDNRFFFASAPQFHGRLQDPGGRDGGRHRCCDCGGEGKGRWAEVGGRKVGGGWRGG